MRRRLDLRTLKPDERVQLGASEWQAVDQARIGGFAEVTGDHQWIHVDPARAAQEMPGGKTIAHGLLTLSIAVAQVQELVEIVGTSRRVNYGVNKVRFLAPVVEGARIRTGASVGVVEERAAGLLYATRIEVEIEGEERPAMVAETLALAIFEPAAD